MRSFWVGVNEYHTVCSLPLQNGSSSAVVASAVLMLSVNGNAPITAALSKSSLAGCARAGGTFNRVNSSPARTPYCSKIALEGRLRSIWWLPDADKSRTTGSDTPGSHPFLGALVPSHHRVNLPYRCHALRALANEAKRHRVLRETKTADAGPDAVVQRRSRRPRSCTSRETDLTASSPSMTPLGIDDPGHGLTGPAARVPSACQSRGESGRGRS